MFFLGAGASKSAGLPLTEELLRRILDPVGNKTWQQRRTRTRWTKDLQHAFKVLYPDGGAQGFRPSVAGFFTVLEVVALVHEGRERLPLEAHSLLRDLRCEIALGLEAMAEGTDLIGTPHYRWFTAVDRPAVVVTTNWDTLIERAAMRAGLVVHLTWPLDAKERRRRLRSNELVVLKIHGSTDWGTAGDRSHLVNPVANYYARLDSGVGMRTLFAGGRLADDLLLRYRTLEGMRAGSPKLGFDPPQMATMAVGKQASIDLLDHMWDDAYWALSRAKKLAVVGYSFPDDDLEIRSLLRVSTRRAGDSSLDAGLELLVANPSPDAHDRARASLGTSILSDYRSGDAWDPR